MFNLRLQDYPDPLRNTSTDDASHFFLTSTKQELLPKWVQITRKVHECIGIFQKTFTTLRKQDIHTWCIIGVGMGAGYPFIS